MAKKRGRPKIRSNENIQSQGKARQESYREKYIRKQLNTSRVISIKSHLTIEENNSVIENYIGEMNIECEHCKAKHFIAEKPSNKGNFFNDCCNHGKVQVKSIPMENELHLLFENKASLSNKLFERIRAYNNSFAFASMNANLVNFRTNRRGPFCFKIHGQI